MRCINAPMSSCDVCLCVSVMFVDCVKTNKDIRNFSPLGSHTILVFPYQMGWRYSDVNPSNGDIECRLGRQKLQFWAYMPAVDAATGEVLSTWSPMEHGHHLASCDTYIAGRMLWVFDHQAPRAIKSPSPWFFGATATNALFHYTQSRRQQKTIADRSCVWQQGLTLRRRQQNTIELYALVNPKLK